MGSLQQVIHSLQACFVYYVATGYPTKLWNLENCFTTWRPSTLHEKTSLWSFSKEKKTHESKEQKQLSKATTSSSVSALRASFLVADHTAKAEEPFTAGEELILPAAKDLCHELLGDTAVQ